jgi:LacI family transcriptional regulator
MAATVRDVARRAGVSAMTVSRVVNRQAGVSAETRARIEAAIAELNYAPNKVASGLTSARTELIGMIVPDVSNPFFGPVVRGAEMVARGAGYRLLLCNSESDLELERRYVEDLVGHRVEGLLIAPVGDRSALHLSGLVGRGFPVVLIDRQVAGLDCDRVGLDNVAAARQMTAHLIEAGHRRIAFVADSDSVSTGRERLAGVRQAMAAAALPFGDEQIFRTSTDRAGGHNSGLAMLGMAEPPTAIFAVNNMTAVGVMQALRERGLQVPRDMALCCFDDVEHLAILAPVLTVIDQPAEGMARAAMEMLLKRMEGKAGPQSVAVTFPGRLIVRESSRFRG